MMPLAEEEEEDELGEPLILRIDQGDQGSVGSEDTSRFDSDDDLPLPETGQRRVWYMQVHASSCHFSSKSPTIQKQVCSIGLSMRHIMLFMTAPILNSWNAVVGS